MNNTQFVIDFQAAVTDLLRAVDRLAALRSQYATTDVGGRLEDTDIPAAQDAPTAAQFIDAVAAADQVIADARVTPLTNLRTGM